jgi:predicted nucleic acid-binding protein
MVAAAPARHGMSHEHGEDRTLFSASLRDTLLRAAKTELYSIRETDEILEELQRTLSAKRKKSEPQVQRLISAIEETFPNQFVKDYQHLIEQMPVNENDRHVLAAAVASNAQVIVTHNLRHFRLSLLAPYEMEAQSPDTFLLQLLESEPDRMKHVLIQQAASLRHPPMITSEVLDILELEVPIFVKIARRII